MQIEIVTEYDDFMALETIWKNVQRQSRNDIICLTHEWFRCWWHSFGEGKKLFILVVKEEDKVIGIAPLHLARGTYRNMFRASEVGFCVNGMSPRVDFISIKNREEAVIEFILNYLFDNCQLWDILRLNKICTKSPTYKILMHLLSKRNRTFRITEAIKSPYISIKGKWDDFYAGRSRNFRKGMRNKLNRVKRFGDVRIEKIQEEGRLYESLPILYDISGKSWKDSVGKSLPKRKCQVAFYDQITRIMGKKGWINIWLVQCPDGYIAFEYHLVYKGMIYPIRADFDEKYKAISPGSFLEYNIIRMLFDDPSISEYDFCGDNYWYMQNWTESANEHVSYAIFNNRFVSKSLSWLECHLVPKVKKGVAMVGKRKTRHKAGGRD